MQLFMQKFLYTDVNDDHVLSVIIMTPFDFTSGFCWVEFRIYSTFPRGTVIVLYEIPSQNSKEHA